MNTDAIKGDWTRRVYLTWLARDVRYALATLGEAANLTGQVPPDPKAWMLLESFLMYTAKVSKMLKPIIGRPLPSQTSEGRAWRGQRGKYLCGLLEVPNDAAVLDRKVRDAAEHFDEYLDEWVVHHPRPTTAEWEQGIGSTFPPPPAQRIDAASWRVTVAGQELDLGTIEGELRQILAKAVELEPLAGLDDTGLATGLAGLPPLPSELRLNAPTRRPDEHIMTGTGQPIPAVGANSAQAPEGPHIAAAVVVQDHRVLLVRRRNREGTLLWQLPAGKLQHGETPHAAAARETREETGLDVAFSELLGERRHPDTGRYLFYVACQVVAGVAEVIAPEEIAEVAWVEHGALPKYVPQGFFPPVQAYLDAALRP
ncbi:NUDIX hydrolase [Kitasatospora sp. NPDC001095]